MEPLLSIVVPVYNREKTIAVCIESIIRQDYKNIEIIIVDDGSADSTISILKTLQVHDSRIKIICKENGGVSSARNTGIDNCHGKYVRFVDSDDVLVPDTLSDMIAIAEKNDSDLVLCPYIEQLGNNRTVRDLGKRTDTISRDELLDILTGWCSNSFYYGVLWNKLFRLDNIKKGNCRFLSGLNWGEDFSFVCDYIASGINRISYSDTPVYVYQRNTKGLTAHQAISCISHPIVNIKMKFTMYGRYRSMYKTSGRYDRYKRTLWTYLIKFTVNE